MRIAVVSDYTLATLGGAENSFHEQVRALAGAGHEVLAICPRSDRLAALGRVPGVLAVGTRPWFVVPGFGFPVLPNGRRVRERLRRLLVEHRVEVVHLHSEFGVAAAATTVAHELGIAVVQTVHTFFWQTTAPIQRLLALGVPVFHRAVTGLAFPDGHDRRGLADRPGDAALRAMTLSVAREVDRVVSPSAHQAERLRAAGLARVDVVPNTVLAPEDVTAPAEVLGAVTSPLRIVWIGRLVPEKRVLEFLDAMREVLARRPGAIRVDVIGDGELRRRVEQVAAVEPGIVVHGRLPHEEVTTRLAEAHVSALTSIGWDNQPMTVVESVLARRGVVWCDPALTEGLVAADGSPGPGIPAFGTGTAPLVDAVLGLLDDPERAVRASAACVVAGEDFTARRCVERLDATYRSAQNDLTARAPGRDEGRAGVPRDEEDA